MLVSRKETIKDSGPVSTLDFKHRFTEFCYPCREMKGLAYILISCLLFLGTESLRETFHFPGNNADIVCESDCCGCHEDQGNKSCDEDHDCESDCNCCHHFQITALEYKYLEVPGATVQSYHFGHYLNSYSYQYTDNFLQPPRFA